MYRIQIAGESSVRKALKKCRSDMLCMLLLRPTDELLFEKAVEGCEKRRQKANFR